MSTSSSNGANPPASGVQQDKVNPTASPSVNPTRGHEGAQGRISADRGGAERTTSRSSVTIPANIPLDSEAYHRFASELFAGVPGLVEYTVLTSKDRLRPIFRETTPEELINATAAAVSAEKDDNLSPTAWYIRMTTLDHAPAEPWQRGGAENVRAFVGFWADGDFGTEGHKTNPNMLNPLPNPAEAEAMAGVYEAAGLPEHSVEWNSGGGLNRMWLLDEPVIIDTPEKYGDMSEASRRWHKHIENTARDMGLKYGGVHNLDRLMRAPGSVNRKAWPKLKKVTAAYTGKRYSLGELMALIPEPLQPVQAPSGDWVNPETGEIVAKAARPRRAGEITPWDDFNERGPELAALITSDGWQRKYITSGGWSGWVRPGKELREGIGATLDWIPGRMRVFSNAAGLPTTMHTKFSYYAWTRHDGDMKEAARALRAGGYGSGGAAAEAPDQDMWAVEQTDDHGNIIPKRRGEPPADAPVVEAGENDTPERVGETAENVALPIVDITNERDALHELTKLIRDGALPEVYVRDGRLVHVGVVSGARNGRRKKSGAAAERQAPDMGPSQMRALIAKNLVTIAFNAKGAPSPKLPAEALCKAILAQSDWEGMPDLTEITPMPFVRPDGTIRQESGYDPDTGIWLNVDDGFPEVPEKPTPEDVAAAKELLLDTVLHDFPWVADADRANYIAFLATPALKQVIDGLSPFAVITAAVAGSGKSALAKLISRTYGGNGDATTLSRQDEEIRKVITTKLMNDPHAVVTFDNIGKHHAVDSPVLAQLLTSPVWSDRVLGGNDNVSRVNDKLWLATGNNVRLGGDMASRSVFVRIDAKMERPDRRSTDAFAIGDIETWITDNANIIRVMHALLVLIRAWAAAGMPLITTNMRSFTSWARVTGGLLAFHGIDGFLSNTDDVEDADEETYELSQFLRSWSNRHGETWMTTAQLIASHKATQYEVMGGGVDPWEGTFPVKDNGQAYTTHALGAKLKHVLDRPVHGWVLRQMVNKTTNQRLWRAEKHGAEKTAAPTYEQAEL